MPISEVINDGEWPQEFVDLILERDRNDVKNIHVTDLSGCLRQAIIRNTEPYTVHTSKLYPLLRGVIMHAGIEALLRESVERDGGEVERSLRTKVGNTTIAGTLDYYKSGVIRDWKVPLRSKPPSPGYIQQLNIYNWMLEEEGHATAEELELVAFEPSKLKVYSVPRWHTRFTKDKVQQRLRSWQGEYPPPEGIDLGYCKYCPVQENCFAKPDMQEIMDLLEESNE